MEIRRMTATARLSPPMVFADDTARAFVAEVAGVLAEAGLEPYVGPWYSDSQLRGLEMHASNAQPWSVHDPDAGSPYGHLVRGGPKPGQALIGVEIWGTHGNNSLYKAEDDGSASDEISERAVDAMAGRITRVLRDAGLAVTGTSVFGWDSGFGTRNVGFAVVFDKPKRQ
jgi:hypothetical protein